MFKMFIFSIYPLNMYTTDHYDKIDLKIKSHPH